VGLARLLRPRSAPGERPSADDLARAEPIIARSRRTYAQLARLGDKQLLFHDSGDAFLMYAVQGRTWAALGDPVGPAEQTAELVWRFRELCDRFAGHPAFYQVGLEHLPAYLEQGCSLQKLGEEGRVSLADFSLEGPERRTLRAVHHKFERSDCTFEVVPVERAVELLPELRAISDSWLSSKNVREKGFSLGFFQEAYLARCPIALVRRRDQLVAFANVLAGAERFELSVDLMRHRPDAPGGMMDSLFVELMLWGQAQGFRWFSLGMAPLAGLEAGPLSPVWNRLADLLYRHGEHFYNFQGLRQYKEKFHPEWSPRYLASPGGLALPQTLSDIATLIAGGVGGLVGR
jgi:phosphatidylglycerol lysyltransferase